MEPSTPSSLQAEAKGSPIEKNDAKDAKGDTFGSVPSKSESKNTSVSATPEEKDRTLDALGDDAAKGDKANDAINQEIEGTIGTTSNQLFIQKEDETAIVLKDNVTETAPTALVPKSNNENEELQPWDTVTYKSLPKSSDGRQLRETELSLPTPLPQDTLPFSATMKDSKLPMVVKTRKYLLEPNENNSQLEDRIVKENDDLLDSESVASILDIVKLGAIKDTDKYGYVGQVNPEWKPHGEGVYLWTNNDRYEGHWENGLRHGYGVNRWASGDTYAGMWENDLQKGDGQMVYASDYGPPGHEVMVAGRVYYRDPWDINHQHSEGNRYIGERSGTNGIDDQTGEALVINTTDMTRDLSGLTMANDHIMTNDNHGRGGRSIASNATTITLRVLKFTGVRDGIGRYLFPDGSYYNGQWDNDQMSGMGRLDMKNGDCYVGEFHKNKRDGQGMCTYANGCTYNGSWSKDHRQGDGIQWFDNGDKYEGEWDHDMMDGEGSYVWYDGVKYKGQYKNGKRHGIGKCDYLDGSINQGKWEKDTFLGKKFTPDYDYVGEYNMTLNSYLYATKTGYGKKIWKDGSNRMYNGEWYGDRMAGHCNTMTNFDGPNTTYSGQLHPQLDGVKHGQGIFTAANGDIYEGQWDHGKKHGSGKEIFAATGEIYTGKWYQGRSMRRGGR